MRRFRRRSSACSGCKRFGKHPRGILIVCTIASVPPLQEVSIMKRIPRPSPALVISCIALSIALTGVSYAAVVIPRNSVGTLQLKANAVELHEGRERHAAQGRLQARPDPGRRERTGRRRRSRRSRRPRRSGRRSGDGALGAARRRGLARPQQGRRVVSEARDRRLSRHLQSGRDGLHIPGDARWPDDRADYRRGQRRPAHGDRRRSPCLHLVQRRSERRQGIQPGGLLLIERSGPALVAGPGHSGGTAT